ncbi:MAG: hypothetical protein WBZ19_17000 [Chthoniobacterales bacterium]
MGSNPVAGQRNLRDLQVSAPMVRPLRPAGLKKFEMPEALCKATPTLSTSAVLTEETKSSTNKKSVEQENQASQGRLGLLPFVARPEQSFEMTP